MANNNKKYIHLIDNVVQSGKSNELVKKVIPILIRWAKEGQSTMVYDDLIKELGYTKYSGIGSLLGRVNDVLNQLSEKIGEIIPSLNVLVRSKKTGLPSDGFCFVFPSYNKMTKDEQILFVEHLTQKVFDYDWDWVLSVLGLTPSVIDINASECAIRSGKFIGNGGEGYNHRKLKEFVYYHPESVEIKDFKERKMEHILLSGDRLDVFFELNNSSKVAVEIKSSSSSDADFLRGLFQCVKYKAILDAEDKVHSEKSQNKAILVIDGELSSENKKVQEALGITIFKVSAK